MKKFKNELTKAEENNKLFNFITDFLSDKINIQNMKHCHATLIAVKAVSEKVSSEISFLEKIDKNFLEKIKIISEKINKNKFDNKIINFIFENNQNLNLLIDFLLKDKYWFENIYKLSNSKKLNLLEYIIITNDFDKSISNYNINSKNILEMIEKIQKDREDPEISKIMDLLDFIENLTKKGFKIDLSKMEVYKAVQGLTSNKKNSRNNIIFEKLLQNDISHEL